MPQGKSNSFSVINLFQCLLGIGCAAIGIKSFLLPNNFIDGGVTGVSMLVSELSHTEIAIWLIVINLPFVLIGYRQISTSFAVRSAVVIFGLALTLALVQFPVATTDKLLTAVFGGILVGAGIGLTVRAGAVLDGTEILALILARRFGLSIGDIILGVNVLIFTFAAVFLGLEPALYSILTYFAASKTIDFILHGIEEYNGMIIVSYRSDEIKTALLEEMGRGVTVFRGRGGMSDVERDILFCVVTRLELPKARILVKEIDHEAFVVIHQISDATGGVVKKRVFH